MDMGERNTKRSKTKDILFVADVSIEKVIGGAERVLYEQGIRLVGRGCNVHIITRLLAENEDCKKIIQSVVEWRYRVDFDNAISFLKTTWKNSNRLFKTLYDKNQFDAIIIHQPFSAFGIIQSPLSRKIKRIYVCHSLSFEEYISRNAEPNSIPGKISYCFNIQFRKWLERRIINRCDDVIALSRYTKEKIVKAHQIPSKKISIIPGGVDLDRFQEADDKKKIRGDLQIPEEKTILFTVRNLVRRMGLENLLDAMGQVVRTASDIYLVIGGAGPLKDDLVEKAQQLNIGDHIRFVGFIPEEKLPEYYAMADLFILPTRELEGFGLVTLEAMASGVPVLGTPVGGTLEILGEFDSSFLFRDTTSDSIAALIEEKCQIIKEKPEEWKEIAKKCRLFVEDNYSWEQHIDALEKFF